MQAALLVVLILPTALSELVFHEKVVGQVGAENYTYYSLFQEGSIFLRLRTLVGDADLYVGKHHPTYEVEEHAMHSATCGLDELWVPAGAERPLVVGVYGHPSHTESRYELEVGVDRTPSSFVPPVGKNQEVEESFVWTVLFSILKVLLEVITS